MQHISTSFRHFQVRATQIHRPRDRANKRSFCRHFIMQTHITKKCPDTQLEPRIHTNTLYVELSAKENSRTCICANTDQQTQRYKYKKILYQIVFRRQSTRTRRKSSINQMMTFMSPDRTSSPQGHTKISV